MKKPRYTKMSKSMASNIKCKLTLIIMGVIIITNVVSVGKVEGTVYGDQLGTNSALGSPLVDDSFTADEWNKWEMVTFGIFMSNFCTPLIDSYESAFTSGKGGTDGAGLSALVFGTGGDVNGNKVLKTMVDYCIKAQKASRKEITVKWKELSGASLSDYPDKDNLINGKQATMSNIMLLCANDTGDFALANSLKGTKDGLISTYVWTAEKSKNIKITEAAGGNYSEEDLTYEYKYASKALLPVFYVNYGTSKEQVIFDLTNGWDIMSLTGWFNKALNSNDDAAKELVSKFKSNEKLYLDVFGNIVCGDDNKIVIPACVNQYLTKDKQYNMLNSVILDTNFGVAKSTNVNNLYGGESGGGGINGGSADKTDALLLYQDTDSYIGKKMSGMKATTENGYTYYLDEQSWGADLDIGKAVYELINSDINNENYTYPFKMELTGCNLTTWENIEAGFKAIVNELPIVGNLTDGAKKEVARNTFSDALELLGNVFSVETQNPILNYMYTGTTSSGSNKTYLFNTHKYVSPQIEHKDNDTLALKSYISYVLENAEKRTVYADNVMDLPSGLDILEGIRKSNTAGILAQTLYRDDGDVKDKFTLKNTVDKPAKSLIGYLSKSSYFGKSDTWDYNKFRDTALSEIDNTDYIKNKGEAQFKKDNIIKSTQRIAKVYLPNQDIKSAMNVLNIAEGTEFAVWTPYVYITYLEWYGIIGNRNVEFNTNIYDLSSDLLNTTGSELFNGVILTEEEKDKVIKNNTYLLLSVGEDGRAYRNELTMNWFEDMAHTQYNKICYGSAYKVDSGAVTSKTSQGFLNMDSYSSNFMTSWFINGYVKYIMTALLVILLLIVVSGIIMNKKLSWFAVALAVAVIVTTLLPSTGEAVPYVCNKIVQGMFKDSMTYWAVAESINNSTKEAEINEAGSSGANVSEVVRLTRLLNTVQLDKTIMIKTDISKKIVEDTAYDIEELQKVASVRWLLPTLIRQFSANDGSANYVYTTLGDLYDYESRMYWYYVPEDAANSDTYLGKNMVQTESNTTEWSSIAKQSWYAGYKDLSVGEDEPTWRSLSRRNTTSHDGNADVVHSNSYIMTMLGVGDVMDNVTLTEAGPTWEKLTDENTSSENGGSKLNKTVENTKYLQEITQKLVTDINGYSLYTSDVNRNFGFLWNTESPAHYFYQVLKDTVNTTGYNGSLAKFVGEIQGYYETDAETGDETRRSFMRYASNDDGNGEIRDFLDLEEMFTNMIPYMYQVQLMAGGDDGTNGLLGDSKLNGYAVYKNNYQSWLYRSNWITKLMEYEMYYEPCKVEDKDGNKYTVKCPILPQSYPEERPMVFSEAQMRAQGLHESDLNYLELKLIKINTKVERKWTYMLNYANTSGMTLEVMIRQMAIDATMIFNDELSPDNIINEENGLYPSSLDLRNISFDSVMKLIMMSSTRNSSYIYNDTMKSVIADSNVIDTAVLLVDAWLCSNAIPFVRNVVLGLLFYLGILALILNMFSSGRVKVQTGAAYLINSVVYGVIIVCFYKLIGLLITSSNPDSVLSTSSVTLSVGVPSWKFWWIFGACILFIILSYMLATMILKHYRDLGYQVYATVAGNIANGVGNKLDGIKGNLSGYDRAKEAIERAELSGDKVTVNVENKADINEDVVIKESMIDDSAYVANKRGESLDTAYFDREIDKGKDRLNSKDN